MDKGLHDMKERSGLVLLLGCALVVVLLLLRAGSLEAVSHDDVITFLAASGHEGAYATERPEGAWVPASTWQRYWSIERRGAFGQIAHDLARFDLHPPLYFWLVHLWALAFPLTVQSVAVLNVILYVGAVLLLVRLARSAGAGSWPAVACGLVWAFATPHLLLPNEARAYVLLAALAAAFMLALEHAMTLPSPVRLVATGALAAAGVLTHYQFALLVGAALLACALLLGAAGRARAALAIGSAIAAGVGLGLGLLHPGFVLSLERAATQHVPQTLDLLGRVRTALLVAASLFVPVAAIATPVGLVLAPWLALLGLGFSGVALARLPRETWRTGSLPLLAGAGLIGLGATVVLYVSGLSPPHVGRLKYGVAFTPVLLAAAAAAASAPATERARRRVGVALVVLLVCQAVLACRETMLVVSQNRSYPRPIALERRTPVLLDSTARGVLPVILWHVDPGVLVHAAPQESLLVRFPMVPDSIRRLVYVSDDRYGNTTEGAREIVRRLREEAGFQPTVMPGGVHGTGTLIWLER